MKTVNYNNGYACFHIPKNWVEEYEDDGALLCYDENSDDEFSLRLSIITMKPPSDLSNPKTEDFIQACGIPDYAEKIMIDSNNVIAIHRDKENGEGTDYLIYYYEYVHKKTNGHFDLAIFTWSIEERLERDTTYINLLSMIEAEAKALKFKD